MKLLVITDSYPPYHSGGYEIRCKDVLEQLILRGHDLEIITTHSYDKKINKLRKKNNIHRRLNVETSSMNLIRRIYQDYKDINFLDRRIKSFRPDIIYIWHVINLSKAIFPYLADANIPTVFDEGGKGLVYSWTHRGAWYYFVEHHSTHHIINRLKPIVINIISKFSQNKLRNQWAWPKNLRAYFNSEYNLKNTQIEGVPMTITRVIHSGIEIEKFSFKPRKAINSPVKIIVPGRIAPNKGTKDVVLLLAKLKEHNINANVTIVGKVFNDIYYQEVQKQIKELGLEIEITVLPMLEHYEMIKLYQKSDICFFPSYQLYGLSRVPLEAMACGCLVFAYGNEGSDEIIKDNETGFIVPEGNIAAIINIIQELVKDRNRYQKIIHTARKCVEENHSMDFYVDKIELFLQETVDVSHSKN